MSDDEYELLVEAMCAEKETNTSNFIRKAISEYINNHFKLLNMKSLNAMILFFT